MKVYCIKCLVDGLVLKNKSSIDKKTIEFLISQSKHIEDSVKLIGELINKIFIDNEDYDGYYEFTSYYMKYYICSCDFPSKIHESTQSLLDMNYSSANEALKLERLGMKLDANKIYLNDIKERFRGEYKM